VLVQGVTQDDKGALGYFGYAYYAENTAKLKAVPIVNPKRQGVCCPRWKRERRHLRAAVAPDLHLREGEGLQRAEVKKFVEFYMKHGAKLSREVKLRAAARGKAYTALEPEEGQAGHGFGGKSEVGITIEELLAREGKL
jgi:phosphate transport system substrate-binding protein